MHSLPFLFSVIPEKVTDDVLFTPQVMIFMLSASRYGKFPQSSALIIKYPFSFMFLILFIPSKSDDTIIRMSYLISSFFNEASLITAPQPFSSASFRKFIYSKYESAPVYLLALISASMYFLQSCRMTLSAPSPQTPIQTIISLPKLNYHSKKVILTILCTYIYQIYSY